MCEDIHVSNKQMLDTLMRAITDIKEEGKNNKEELKKEIKAESQLVINKLEENSSKIKVINEKLKELENRCINADRLRRKNNILIFGLDIPQNADLLNYTINKLQGLLDIQLQESDFNNIYILKNEKNPIIKVEFISYLKKDLVSKNCSKLKGTKIFIRQDLCPEDRDDYKILTENLKKARAKNYFAKIKGKTLEINGEIYTVQQLRELNSEQKTEEATKEPLSPGLCYGSNSAPATPTPPTFLRNKDNKDINSAINQNEIEEIQIIPRKEQLEQRKKYIEENKTNTPSVSKKIEERKAIQRTNSTSSVKSDKSDRQLRHKK